MVLEPDDAPIAAWARSRRAPFYYACEDGLPGRCLKVQLGYVTAYFERGRLRRVWAHADDAVMEEMFVQLTDLFSAAGRPWASDLDHDPEEAPHERGKRSDRQRKE